MFKTIFSLLNVLALIFFVGPMAKADRCRPASQDEVAQIDLGNLRTLDFLIRCAVSTDFSPWCSQLLVPNIESIETFRCTYGDTQLHQLLDPDESTWGYAFQAVRLIQMLQAEGIQVCEIYNWWRPEPYNTNVAGKPGRHPFGTAVDVRFCAKGEADKAFVALCRLRKQGQQLNAIGYYGNERLHLGIGDTMANTWGRSCDSPRVRPRIKKMRRRNSA